MELTSDAKKMVNPMPRNRMESRRVKPRLQQDGRHPDVLPLDRRLPQLRAQADESKTPKKTSLPQAAVPQPGLPSTGAQPARRNRSVWFTCFPAAQASYIYLTGQRLARGPTSIPAWPLGVQTFIVLDRKDDRLVGIEILNVRSRLHLAYSKRRRSSAENGSP